MKKVFLWIGIVLLTPILLFVILTILLYLPPVQSWAVQKGTAYASEATGMNISIERVRLVFPLNLGVDGLLVTRANDTLPGRQDTIAGVRRMVADVRLRPLFSGQVVVDELSVAGASINTLNLVPSAHVQGTIGQLDVKSRGIDLGLQTVAIDEAVLSDARIAVALSDTVPEDTTQSEVLWKIMADRVALQRTALGLSMPGDTLQIHTYIENSEAREVLADLGPAHYAVGSFVWAGGSVAYDNRFEPHADGLDPNHISLSAIDIAIDSIDYCAPEARLRISRFAMTEKSGLRLDRLTGEVRLDSAQLHLPQLVMRTPDSQLDARMTMDLSVTDSISPGRISLRLMASLGKQDVMRFCGGLPSAFVRSYPNRPLTIRGSVGGNLRHIDITGLQVALPTAFDLSADGSADNVTDMKHLRADVRLKGRTDNLGFVTALADIPAAYAIPRGITLNGRLRAEGERYSADLTAHEGRGRVHVDGSFDAAATAYNADVEVHELNLHHFMPHDSLYTVTAHAAVTGHGTDMLSRHTRLEAKA